MPFVTVGQENGNDVQVYFEDHGTGRPVVFMHGFPLDGTSWEKQTTAVLRAGYRAITIDRRGFGRSDRPVTGYDYETFAADFKTVLDHLDVTDAVLVGFSMGTGDVVQYLGRYGSARVRKAVLIASIAPGLAQSPGNPDGFPESVFEDLEQAIDDDRFAYLTDYHQQFYRLDLVPDRVHPAVIESNLAVAMAASAWATHACVNTWRTDHTDFLPKIDVPVLALQGTDDSNIPIGLGVDRLPGLIPDVEVVRVEGGPHNIPWTHAALVNETLLKFLA